ncbi:MAG TPA: cell division topological specificity factor MinE [Stellaceae bacterium]|nr:cell division topological specificity factor MinE [Stellaceae bacterium]
MSLFDFFFPKKPASASIAKERLQIVLAHERAGRNGPDFLPLLQKELLAVVARYIPVKDDMIHVHLGRAGTASVLEINIEMPITAMASSAMRTAPA